MDELFKGKWHQYKGKIREKWGKLTHDDIEQINGRREHLIGKLQSRYSWDKKRAEDELKRFESSNHFSHDRDEMSRGHEPRREENRFEDREHESRREERRFEGREHGSREMERNPSNKSKMPNKEKNKNEGTKNPDFWRKEKKNDRNEDQDYPRRKAR